MYCVTAPVAVFDSGIGGIGVLRELQKLLPNESFLYFGDRKNAPYGEKTAAALQALVLSHATRLLCRCKALVLACNTATAVAAERLRAEFCEPIIGIEPALAPALCASPAPRILVLATSITLKEEKFAALLARCRGRAEIRTLAAPLLVRFAENGITRGTEVDAYLRTLLAPMHAFCPTAVVLGCTHFPLFQEAIAAAFPYPIRFFDGAYGTAKQTKARLLQAGLLRPTPTAEPPAPIWSPCRCVFAFSRRITDFNAP